MNPGNDRPPDARHHKASVDIFQSRNKRGQPVAARWSRETAPRAAPVLLAVPNGYDVLGARGGGIMSWAVRSSGRVSQACLLAVQTDCSGFGNVGSAKPPTATPIRSGMRSGSQYSVDPQSGQKWKSTCVPTTELRMKFFDLPCATFTASRRKKAAMLNTLPVRR